MPLLMTKTQIAAKLEAVTGVAETLAAADVKLTPLEVSMTPEFDAFEREFVRSTFTRLLGITTEEMGALALTTELRGTQLGTFAGLAPGWFDFARACHMEQGSMGILRITGAITGGPFRHGEIVTDAATTPARATVVHDWHDGTAVVYIRNTEGDAPTAFDVAGLLTGESSGATATLTTGHADDQGYSLWPISETEKTIDCIAALSALPSAGDVIEGAVSGALGVFISQGLTPGFSVKLRPLEGSWNDSEAIDNRTLGTAAIGTTAADANELFLRGGSMTARLLEDGYYSEIAGARGNMKITLPQVNRPGRVEFAMAGFWNAHGDTPLLTGTAENATQPPIWRNQSVFLGDNLTRDGVAELQAAEYNPCLAALELDLGNQLVNRECQGAAKGIEEVLVSERQGSGRITPELTLAAVHDWIQFFQNATPVRMRTTVGANNGNKFFITAPGIQYTAAGPGDRNKILQRDMGYSLTGGNLNNLAGASITLSTNGGDNEVVITYLTSA